MQARHFHLQQNAEGCWKKVSRCSVVQSIMTSSVLSKGLYLASFPGPCLEVDKKGAWCTLFAHAQFPQESYHHSVRSKVAVLLQGYDETSVTSSLDIHATQRIRHKTLRQRVSYSGKYM